MIMYVTKETFERYKLKPPADLKLPWDELARTVIADEAGDRLYEWGGKLFLIVMERGGIVSRPMGTLYNGCNYSLAPLSFSAAK